MAIKPYPKYKDSGIEWIGKIPEHWEPVRLKYLVNDRLKYGSNDYTEDNNPEHPRYIRITDFGDDGKLRPDTYKSLPPDKAKDYMLKERDILFARSGATVGKTYLFKNYKRKACFAGYLIKASIDLNKAVPEFIYFYTKSPSYEQWKNRIFNQATIQNIGADKYNQLEIPIPGVSEQQSIATYLDRKTKEIEETIAKKQWLIELLEEERKATINEAVTKGLNPNVKMKDSGIEWIGDIPEHWETKRLKYMAKIIFSNVDKKYIEGEKESFLCNYMDVYNNQLIDSSLNFMKATAKKNELTKFKLQKDDVIITKDSERKDDMAVPAFVNDKFENVLCGYHLAILRSRYDKLYGKFIYYIFLNQGIRNKFEKESRGITRYSIGLDILNKIEIPIPSNYEQGNIINFLDIRTKEIDTSIQKIQNQIELLKEYRQSLIFEAVTGKIDVREEVKTG